MSLNVFKSVYVRVFVFLFTVSVYVGSASMHSNLLTFSGSVYELTCLSTCVGFITSVFRLHQCLLMLLNVFIIFHSPLETNPKLPKTKQPKIKLVNNLEPK